MLAALADSPGWNYFSPTASSVYHMSLYTIWLTFLQCVQNYCSVSNMSLYTIWLTLMHLFSYTNIWYIYYILLACNVKSLYVL